MAKKSSTSNPLALIGKDYITYTVTKYCGENENGTPMYEITFKDTGNKAVRAKTSISGGRAVDMQKKLEATKAKSVDKRRKISRAGMSNPNGDIDVLYGDFDMDKNTLVLDQATITSGFVIVKEHSVDTMGFLRQNKNEDLAVRVHELKKEIKGMIIEHNIKNLVLEEIFLGQNLKTYRALCMLIGVLVDLCVEMDLSCTLVLASVWREKYGIKGTRSACKAKALSLIRLKFGIEIGKTEEDLAEAILITFYILDQYGKDNVFNWE